MSIVSRFKDCFGSGDKADTHAPAVLRKIQREWPFVLDPDVSYSVASIPKRLI